MELPRIYLSAQVEKNGSYCLRSGNWGVTFMLTPSHNQQLIRQGRIEQALHQVDIEHEFSLVFQPVIDLRSRRTVAFEALARWSSLELGDVPPSQFIPIAERIGLINRLTTHLLGKALTIAADWPPHISLSFNLSTHDCASDEVAEQIVSIIQGSNFDPRRLDLEITETAIMQDVVQVQHSIDRFCRLGCGVALDDFGTGYSSLSQLLSLAFTKIKIDRAFVIGIDENPVSYKIVKSLVALSRDMQLECIVEGVETREELEALISLGCFFVQGYYFARPMRHSDINDWLKENSMAGDVSEASVKR